MPRLVVAMPARNAQDTIDLALSSTIRALPKDALIVVWNDGSTDGTSGIAHRYVSNKVMVLDSAVGVGGGKARMEIIRRTDSEFIANMDADDFCLPWRFRLQQEHSKRVDVSFTTTFKFTGNPLLLRPPRPISYRPSETAIALSLYNPLPHPTMYARRSTLAAVGGYRDLRTAQDYDLWLRVAAAGGRLGRLACPTVAYRQSASQVTRQVGYAEGIRSNPLIRQSYTDLLEFIQPGTRGRLVNHENLDDGGRDELMKSIASEALETLPPKLRRYHKDIVDNGLGGPFF